MSVCKGEND